MQRFIGMKNVDLQENKQELWGRLKVEKSNNESACNSTASAVVVPWLLT